MRTCFVAALALLFFASAAFSQSNRDRPVEGGYGLIFVLPGFQKFSAENYQGVPVPGDTSGLFGGIGVKYHFSEKLAARVGIGFSNSSTTEKPAAGSPSTDVDEKSTLTVFSLAPGLQFTLVKTGDISGYAGFQLGLIALTSNIDGWGHDPGDSYKNTRWLYSAGGFLGAEWFFNDRLSLGAEYVLQYIIRSGTNKSVVGEISNERDLNTESWLDLKSSSSFNVLLNFYF